MNTFQQQHANTSHILINIRCFRALRSVFVTSLNDKIIGKDIINVECVRQIHQDTSSLAHNYPHIS